MKVDQVAKWGVTANPTVTVPAVHAWVAPTFYSAGRAVLRVDWPISEDDLTVPTVTVSQGGDLIEIQGQWTDFAADTIQSARKGGSDLLWLSGLRQPSGDVAYGMITYLVNEVPPDGDLTFHLCHGDAALSVRAARVEAEPLRRNPVAAFIGGHPKSGTTWVQTLVNSHPDALIFNESDLLPFMWLGPTRHPPRRANVYGGAREILLGRAFTAAALELGAHLGFRIVGDKTPADLRTAELLAHADQRVHVVHCMRRPMDVVVSYAAHLLNIARRDPALVPQYVRQSADDSVSAEGAVELLANNAEFVSGTLTEWVHCNWGAGDTRPNDSRVTLVYYEDLVREPIASTEALLNAVTLGDLDRSSLIDLIDRCSFREMSGGRDQGHADATKFVREGGGGAEGLLSDEAQSLARTHLKSIAPASLWKLLLRRDMLDTGPLL